MTNTERQDSSADLASDPDYQALGNAGNPFTDKSAGTKDGSADAGMDHTPDSLASDDSAENPPLPDWGPTDGEHGVDGSDPAA